MAHIGSKSVDDYLTVRNCPSISIIMTVLT